MAVEETSRGGKPNWSNEGRKRLSVLH